MTAALRLPLMVSSWPVTPDGKPATLVAALARNAAEEGARAAYRERDRGVWLERSWADMFAEVIALAAELEALGLGPEQALIVIGDNRTRLYGACLAAMALRAFPAPVFPDVPPDELLAYTRHGAPHIALAEDQEQVDKLLELRDRIGRPTTILYDDPRGLSGYKAEGLISLDAAIARGQALIATAPALAADLVGRAQADDIAVLLHSSGTTGAPKGVPLRHRNIIAGVEQRDGGRLFRGARRALRLSADGLGRRSRLHARRRRRCCASPSTFPSGRRPCCATCAKWRRRSISPRRARGTIC